MLLYYGCNVARPSHHDGTHLAAYTDYPLAQTKTMQFKQAFTLPPGSEDGDSSKVVHIRHPAYPDTEPDLLRFNALDGDGIQYDIAFTSCCIVTGNTFSTGWLAIRVLSDDGDGPHFHRVGRPDDGILHDLQYYFCIGEHDPTTCKCLFPLYLVICP